MGTEGETMISKEIEKKINDANDGELFIMNDFSEYGNYETIKKNIQRLALRNKLQKVYEGIYMKPRFSKLSNSFSPCSPFDLANCIARKFGWEIVPTGDAALNYFGLSNQVPSKFCFVSTGPYKVCYYGPNVIVFKHTTTKRMANMPKKVQYLIQAISFYGKDRFDDHSKRTLSYNVDESTLDDAIKYAKTVDKWIYDLIKELKGYKNNEKDNKNKEQ